MTGTYIHADGTGCHHGIDPDTLDWLDTDADLNAADLDLMPRPRPRCLDGNELMGYRLDPGEPAP